MRKIKDIDTALTIFEEASVKQAEATEIGDYKTANRCYEEITKAANFIKNENALFNLKQFLSHSSIGVRLWAACYLLPVHEKEGINALLEITKTNGIHSLTAETTLTEWKKGNLNF